MILPVVLLAALAASARPSTSDSDMLSVKSFGAVGDGSRDDAPAIQRALTAATAGRTLWFPAGTYRISETLHVGYSCRFLHCLHPPAMRARHPTPSVCLHDIVHCGSRWLG